jgi:ferredoxin
MYRVEIDRQLCSGFAACVDEDPDVFELDASGLATVKVSETDDPRVLKAAKACPMSAISVADAGTGESVT